MPSKTGGKRRAHCKSAGAKGGRPKKAAAADVVLQQPAAELPVKGAVLVRSPAEEQAERGAARTPALFSSANARTTARLLRGSSFLPPFLCFVFTYFPLYAASRVGKGSSFLLLPSLLPLFAALAFIRTLRLSTQFI